MTSKETVRDIVRCYEESPEMFRMIEVLIATNFAFSTHSNGPSLESCLYPKAQADRADSHFIAALSTYIFENRDMSRAALRHVYNMYMYYIGEHVVDSTIYEQALIPLVKAGFKPQFLKPGDGRSPATQFTREFMRMCAELNASGFTTQLISVGTGIPLQNMYCWASGRRCPPRHKMGSVMATLKAYYESHIGDMYQQATE